MFVEHTFVYLNKDSYNYVPLKEKRSVLIKYTPKHYNLKVNYYIKLLLHSNSFVALKCITGNNN